MTLAVEAHHDRVHLVVTDDSPAPAVAQVPTLASLHGRGLAIVGALSTEWGQMEFSGVVETVWADVPVPLDPVLVGGCNFSPPGQ